MKTFASFMKDESGATAIEYGLIAALIAVARQGRHPRYSPAGDQIASAVDLIVHTARLKDGSRKVIKGEAKIFLKDRVAWLVERDFGAYGEFRNPGRGDGSPGKGRIFETEYASSRQMVAWVLHWRQNATVLDPPELAEEVAELKVEIRRVFEAEDFGANLPPEVKDQEARFRAAAATKN